MPIINGLLLAMPLSLLIDWPLPCIRNLFYGTMIALPVFLEYFPQREKSVQQAVFLIPALRVLALEFPLALVPELGFFLSALNRDGVRGSSSKISCGFLLVGMRKNFSRTRIHGPNLPLKPRTPASSAHDLMMHPALSSLSCHQFNGALQRYIKRVFPFAEGCKGVLYSHYGPNLPLVAMGCLHLETAQYPGRRLFVQDFLHPFREIVCGLICLSRDISAAIN